MTLIIAIAVLLAVGIGSLLLLRKLNEHEMDIHRGNWPRREWPAD